MGPNPTAAVMETTALKLAAVCASQAGGGPTAAKPTVLVIAGVAVTALTESVSASRASKGKTAHLRYVLWTVERRAGASGAFVSAQMASLVKTALKPNA